MTIYLLIYIFPFILTTNYRKGIMGYKDIQKENRKRGRKKERNYNAREREKERKKYSMKEIK